MNLSFYYVTTFNVQHPRVKQLLNLIGVSSMCDSMLNMQIRSKLFMDYEKVVQTAQDDFSLKVPLMYGKDESQMLIKMVAASNPLFNPDVENVEEAFADYDWDDDCAGALFYTESENEEDEVFAPGSWMFKYEIFFVEDITEWPRNGDTTYSPADLNLNALSSSYH